MDTFMIRTGSEQMDVPVIHHFLSTASYWAGGISFEMVEHSIKHSFCIGAFIGDRQVAFGRVITDYTTFGWLADFFVLPPHRGKGISKAMLSVLLEQPWTTHMRRLMLNTKDAHGLYRQYGFEAPADTATLMERHRPQAHLE